MGNCTSVPSIVEESKDQTETQLKLLTITQTLRVALSKITSKRSLSDSKDMDELTDVGDAEVKSKKSSKLARKYRAK